MNPKKKWLFLFLTLFVLLMTTESCRRDSFLFEIPMPIMRFDMPAGLNPVETHYFNIQNVPTFIDTVLQAQGVASLDELDKIVPREGRLFNFDNISYKWIFEISVRICPQGETDPNCGVEIFYRAPVPENEGQDMGLIPGAADVSEYLRADRVNYQVKLVQLRDFSPGTVTSRLSVEFQAR